MAAAATVESATLADVERIFRSLLLIRRTEEGSMAESLNFAALHRLPILFICENNGYAIHEPLSKRWATERLCERVATYGMPTCRIVDQDVFAIRDAVDRAVAAMRKGTG